MWLERNIFSETLGEMKKMGERTRDKVREGEGGGLLQGESRPSLYRHCDARWLLLINIQP